MNYIETICFKDNIPQNIEYHITRMSQNSTAKLPDLAALNQLSGRVKCRIVYNHTDVITIEFIPYKLPVIESLRVVESSTILYDRKYEDRSALISLYNEREGCDDIIICKDGNVSDSYFCNLVFSQGGELFTPDTPLLCGTKRQVLIDSGIITARAIHCNDLSKYKGLYLVNAMIDIEDNIFIPTQNIRNK